MSKRIDYQWARKVAWLRRLPSQWQLAYSDVPHRTLATVRLKRHPALRLTDGIVEAELRNTYVDENATTRGDLFLRFRTNK